MTINATTLRPGLLVGLRTLVEGNKRQKKTLIDPDHEVDGGAQERLEQVLTRITDPVEQKEAETIRGRARNIIARVCIQTAFGLLCPADREDRLEEAVREVRALGDEFNDRARVTEISINFIPARFVSDEVEAVRAITGEVRSLMDAMQEGISKIDAEAVRKAASRAVKVSQMLSPQATERVKVAVDAARAAATRIAKAGEAAAAEVDQQALAVIAKQRTMFLDLDDAAEVSAPAPAGGRAVDIGLDDASQLVDAE